MNHYRNNLSVRNVKNGNNAVGQRHIHSQSSHEWLKFQKKYRCRCKHSEAVDNQEMLFLWEQFTIMQQCLVLAITFLSVSPSLSLSSYMWLVPLWSCHDDSDGNNLKKLDRRNQRTILTSLQKFSSQLMTACVSALSLVTSSATVCSKSWFT